jgi:hypothetical protein
MCYSSSIGFILMCACAVMYGQNIGGACERTANCEWNMSDPFLWACRKQWTDFSCKGQLLISCFCKQKLFKFQKISTSSVRIMLTTRILNYSSIFSYPHDNHFKEEILSYLHYYLNLLAILYITYLDIHN